MPLQNRKNRNIRAIAPGKLILIGEYAVLNGAQALVAGTNVYAIASISESQKSFSTFRSENISEDVFKFHLSQGHLELIGEGFSKTYRFIYELLKQFSMFSLPEKIAFDLKIDTRDFYSPDGRKFGLGSSAAATVAAASAICNFLDLDLSRESLFKIVFEAHQEAQNKVGSGIDIAASVYGGILIYSMDNLDRKPVSAEFPHDLYLMPIWTGRSASTVNLVTKLNSWTKENESEYTQLIDAMKKESATACRYFSRGESEEFCKTITSYYNLLGEMTYSSKIPILSDEHIRIREIVRDAGGVYKPSGAGFGDMGIAFYDVLSIGQRIDELLKVTPYQKMSIDFDYNGVHLRKN
jgi:phosphomevalonate kinase